MIASRIHYIVKSGSKNDKNRFLVSRKSFKAGSKAYQILLDEKHLKYSVLNIISNKIELTGDGPSLENLRRGARESLEQLGVRFRGERRNKDTRKSVR